MRHFLRLLAVAPLALAMPRPAAAQFGVLAAGVGLSTVHAPEAEASRTAPVLHARAAWAASRRVQIGVEVTAHDPFGHYLLRQGVAGDSLSVYGREQPVLRTTALLASVQVGEPAGIYVRTGLGVARHAFRVFMPSASGGYSAVISHESGPAAGVALGYPLAIAGFPMQIEGLGQLSLGEDSSTSRWAAGIQLVHAIGVGKR